MIFILNIKGGTYMVVFIGHGMLSKYYFKLELKQPEDLKTVLNKLNMSEELRDQTIFVKEHTKLEYDSIISGDDKIDMFMVTFGG
jgi:hypothetical protein